MTEVWSLARPFTRMIHGFTIMNLILLIIIIINIIGCIAIPKLFIPINQKILNTIQWTIGKIAGIFRKKKVIKSEKK